MFCPKCGSILRAKQEKSKTIMYCSCGFTKKNTEAVEIKETVKTEEKKVEVVGDEESKMLPSMDADCPKCGHKKAFYWLVQTRAGDEPETKFLRCEKCKHTWRDYS